MIRHTVNEAEWGEAIDMWWAVTNHGEKHWKNRKKDITALVQLCRALKKAGKDTTRYRFPSAVNNICCPEHGDLPPEDDTPE